MIEEPIVGARSARWRAYIIAFVITALIFATALYASNYFNERRIADIRATQDTISTDILSLETQFDLLSEHSCENISENTTLPSELTSLGARLSYMESQGSRSQEEIARLKRLYSLLQIKDYLLMKQVAQKCKLKPVFLLYFYSNAGDCADCEKQGYVLTALAQTYPQLRIYSFDYDLDDLSALRTLIDVERVQDKLPALVVGGKTYYGFQSIESIKKNVPALASLESTATSTSPR